MMTRYRWIDILNMIADNELKDGCIIMINETGRCIKYNKNKKKFYFVDTSDMVTAIRFDELNDVVYRITGCDDIGKTIEI